MLRGAGAALLVSAMLGLSLLTGPASAVAPESLSVRNTSSDSFLPGCTTPSQMECIESVDYVIDGQWRAAVGPLVVKTIESDDGNGNIVYGRDLTYFDSPDLSHVEGARQIAAFVIVSPGINGPEFPAYKVGLQPTVVENGRYRSVDPTGLQRTSYRLSFRTSTLVPIFSQVTMLGATTSVTKIPGGLRVAVSGEPGPSQFAGENAERDDRATAITYEWQGFVTDARARNGVLADCQGLGIATAYSNGYGGQIPEWNGRTGTLSFGTGGFHYAPDGSIYRGRAEVFVPGPLARCMWKVDPRQTARMEVEVYTENGQEAAGTKSIGYDVQADLVKMIAIDFTYSEKQVVARPTPIAAKPGKKACDLTNTVCVVVDRARTSAKVTVARLTGAAQVAAVALRGARESGSPVVAPIRQSAASLTVKLSGLKSRGQVWVVRTPVTFVSSFQVG